jgi:hypothetical protein
MCHPLSLTDRWVIARQDRASFRGLPGQRAMVEFVPADDIQSWRCPIDLAKAGVP